MSDGGAQHITFGPFFNSVGVLLPNIKIYHYEAGTTNATDMWSDEDKATPVAQPFVGDTSGIARIFGDNIYKIVIHDENDNLLYTWDTVYISRDVDGVVRNGTSFPSVISNNDWQMAVKKDGSDNFSELGISDGSSFVVMVKMNAAGDTHIFADIAADNITQNGNAVLDITDLLDEDDMASNSDTKGVTQQSLVSYVGSYSNTGIRDIVRNLVVVTNVGNPTYQVDINADEVATQDGAGGFKILSSVNLTVDITVTEANGLDTGSEATDAWYYIWVIAKADGTTAGLLSISSTAPTMPATYTFKALVGAVRNTSGDFVAFAQEDNKVDYNVNQTIKSGSFSTSAWTAQSVAIFAPLTAKRIRTIGGSASVSGAEAVGISPRSDGHSGAYFLTVAATSGITFGEVLPTGEVFSPLNIRYEDTIYYYVTNANASLSMIGWEY